MYERLRKLLKSAGETMVNADRSDIGIDAKDGHANFVTKYDRLVQEQLYNGLMEILPGSGFFGEEEAHDAFPGEECVWIVDPIDGTSNFIKGWYHSCISIALIKDMQRTEGWVYNPYTDELFYAKKGQGALMNDRPIKVSGRPLKEGIVLFGTAPYYDGMPGIAFRRAEEFMDKCIDVRRMGSAALDLCFVACGRAELYFEPHLQPWDIAAGSLIVEEAGGSVTQWDGEDFDITRPCSCLAQGSAHEIVTVQWSTRPLNSNGFGT